MLDLVEAVEAADIRLHRVDVDGRLGITCTDETQSRADERDGQVLQRLDARGHGHREVQL